MENKEGNVENKEEKVRRSSKWKEQILKSYAGLERIALLGENEADANNLESVIHDFNQFFVIGNAKPTQKIKKKFRLLFHNKILDDMLTDQHRDNSVMENQEDSLISGDTLLLRAMSINVEKESTQEQILDKIVKVLVTKCPELIVFPKDNSGNKGITPVHLAILKENTHVLSSMAESLKEIDELRISKEKIQGICAVGPVFQDTVMMAGTPLGVATLKLNKEFFHIVLQHFASGLDVTNDKGDNIVHSLIKFAHVQPDKLNEVLEMLSYVLRYKFITTDFVFEDKKWKYRKQARKLLMMTNKEKLNPLQLAAKRQQFQIFELIMRSEVYHSSEYGDGLLNEEAYDITEIETMRLEDEVEENVEEHIKYENHESVLEYLVHQQTNNAFLFADFMPVKEVIREKWKSCKWWFMGWFVLHLIFMVILSVAAVYRSKLVASVSRNSRPDFAFIVTKMVLSPECQ